MNCLGINAVCVPARKRALEGQESEQTSAPPLLVQVSWARGAGFPLGKHFTASEEHTESHHHDNHLDKHTPLFRPDVRNQPHNMWRISKQTNTKTCTYTDTELVLTNAIFLVPVELLSWWTNTFIAALGVYTAVLTASVADAALINV